MIVLSSPKRPSHWPEADLIEGDRQVDAAHALERARHGAVGLRLEGAARRNPPEEMIRLRVQPPRHGRVADVASEHGVAGAVLDQ